MKAFSIESGEIDAFELDNQAILSGCLLLYDLIAL
jgi:hypothetical protein